jgi:C1A family cysteine protease
MTAGRGVVAFTVLVAIFCALTASGAMAQNLTLAPVNPDFVAYRDLLAAGRLNRTAPGAFGLGCVPSPLDLSGPQLRPRSEHARALPAAFDLRSIPGKVPAMRDSGTTCASNWAFASLGSLETCMRPADTLYTSVQNMKNLSGFDLGHCSGGNQIMATAYLARWAGPVSNADDPYNASVGTSPAGLTVRKHVQEVLYLPDRTGPLDNDTIKQAIVDHGAVYVNFYADLDYFTPGTFIPSIPGNYYYHPGASGYNYAVAIIGWDDSCAASNFRITPPGNGAFLIRNSAGSIVHNGGYFWMSYYDVTCGYNGLAVFDSAEATTNYQTIYQYDPLGWVNSMGVNQETLWTANIFPKSGGGQAVEAAGFYTTAANADYEVYVYRNPLPGSPRTGTLATSASGSFTYAGYHTVVLPSPARLGVSDTNFSVVVKVTTPGYNEPQAVEFAVPGYSSTATSALGQSFYSADGFLWDDLTRRIFTANCCIKAYANPSPPTLEWVGVSGWQTDGVNPNTGSADSTNFVFKVKYQDVSGSAPLKARIVIQKRVGTIWQPHVEQNMALESGAVDTGAIYAYSTTLPNEVYKYRFKFQAADSSWLTLDAPAQFQQGPKIVGPPVLAWTGKAGFAADGVNPDTGPAGTVFQFQVLYTDSLGNSPSTYQVLVRRNGRLYRQKTMRAFASGQYRTGKVYAICIPINHPGTYEYSFLFEDSTGAAVAGDPAFWQSAPTITGVTSAMVTSLTALPARAGAQVTFSLASAASVTAAIVNVAGRPVRTIVADKPLGAGLQTLVWDRKADSGLAAPPGLYLVRVTARDAEGAQSTSMASLAMP